MLKTKRPSFAAVYVANRNKVGRDADALDRAHDSNNASCNWVDLFASDHFIPLQFIYAVNEALSRVAR